LDNSLEPDISIIPTYNAVNLPYQTGIYSRDLAVDGNGVLWIISNTLREG
jgi:hypothetical protein